MNNTGFWKRTWGMSSLALAMALFLGIAFVTIFPQVSMGSAVDVTPTPCADQYEPDDLPAEAHEIATDGMPQTHTLDHGASGGEPADRDWVSFTVQAGEVLSITTFNLADSVDTVIYLYDDRVLTDANAPLLAANDDCGDEIGPSCIYSDSVARTGTYFLLVKDIFGYGGCDFSYDVSVLARSLPTSTPAATPTATVTPTATATLSPTATQTPAVAPTATPISVAFYMPLVLSEQPLPTPTPTLIPCLPRIQQVVHVGAHPKGVAVDGETAYVGMSDASALAVADLAGGALTDTVSGSGLGSNGVAVSANRIFMAHRNSASVSIFSGSPVKWAGSLPVGLLPFGVAACGNRVYVANFGSDTVSTIDADGLALVRDASLPSGARPSLVAAGDGKAYVTAIGISSVVELDSDGNVVATWVVGQGPFGIAYDSLHNLVYVGLKYAEEVVILDGDSGVVLQTLHLSFHPYALAVDPGQGHLYVLSAEENALYVFRPGTDGETPWTVIPLPAVGPDYGGDGITVQDHRIFVTTYESGDLVVVDDSRCLPR